MNQLSPGPHDSQPTGPDTTAGTATPAGGNAAASNAASGPAKDSSGAPATYDAVAGPFTIRDLTVFGSTLLMFVASLLPMFGDRYNLWNLGNLFFLLLGIILPLVVTALFVARRLQPKTIVRVGSLSIDQFASVTASFAFPLFFLTIANSFNGGVLLGLVGSVGLLAATVLGPHLPWLSADFKGRAETPAHIVAREAVVPSRKPAAPKAPKAPKPAASSSTPGFQGSAPGYQAPSPVVSSGAPGAAAGSSPFAPAAPAEAKAAQATVAEANPAQAAAAPAVVHSADGTPGTAPAPSGAAGASGTAPAPSGAGASPATPAAHEATRNGAAGSSEGDKAPASAPEPATTQHATQPAAAQAAAQQPPRSSRGPPPWLRPSFPVTPAGSATPLAPPWTQQVVPRSPIPPRTRPSGSRSPSRARRTTNTPALLPSP